MKASAIVFWIAVWWIASIAIGEELFLPSPWSVFSTLLSLLVRPLFWYSAAFTLLRILSGFVIALVLALLFASIASQNGLFRIVIDPVVRIIRATPVASIVILALVWVSSENLSALISSMMVFPIVYTNVLKGIDETDRDLLEMAGAYHALGLAWKSGIAAEVIGLPSGSIGERVYEAKIYLSTPDLFAWTVTVIVMAFLFERFFLFLSSIVARRLVQ